MNRTAAVLIPLFSLRTADNLGRGEIGGLPAFIDFALAMGHRVVQLLPLGETAPDETSPYSVLSLFAIDPLYISAAALPGVGAHARHTGVLPPSWSPGARARLRAAKLTLLEEAFQRFAKSAARTEREGFDRFDQENRGWLADYALFRALKERFRWRNWESWPKPLRRREPGALQSARRELAVPIRRYCYWQFLAHRQWSAARDHAVERGVMLGGDLAFSPALDSAEVWANQELFRLDRLVGAPPDAFSAKGQRWGLPMPNWPRMRSDDFAWWRMRVRQARVLFDLLRLDHVVGFYRTYSFGADPDSPGELDPAAEADQREQGEAFIRMAIAEAGAGALIAEDLGTVPPWVRASLTHLGVPGFKVMRWEKRGWGTPHESFIPPAAYPELSVAATGTHDTESLTVWWRDLSSRERRQLIEAIAAQGRIDPRRPMLDIGALDALLEAVYAAPSRLVIGPIQDLFGWSARINLPGTVSLHNWSWRLPLPIERLSASPAIIKRRERIRAIVESTGR